MSAIASLTNYPNWVLYRLENKPGMLKPSKIPYSINGERASSTDPATWTTYQNALATFNAGGYSGIGFVFSKNHPYFFFDLDGCRDSETGEINPEAKVITALFPGAAWEVSQSGEGLHIVGICDASALGSRRNKWNGWLEFYTSDRFMALGPQGLSGWTGNCDIDWTEILRFTIPVRTDGDNYSEMIGDGPRADWNGPTDDKELIERAMRAKGGAGVILGTRAPFSVLWNGDAHVLAKFFPDDGGRGRMYDASAADQALMNALAFWTGADYERMIRLFSQSALAQRDKWTKRAYYRNKTTLSSIRSCQTVYNGSAIERRKKQIEENKKIGDEFNSEDLFAPVLNQKEMADRLIYISEVDGIVDIKTFKKFKKEAAKTFFARSTEMIVVGMNADGTDKTKVVKSLDLWLDEFNGIPKRTTELITWKPNAPIICDIPERHGKGVNMWRGFRIPQHVTYMRENPDVCDQWLQAWKTHLAYLVPIEGERIKFEQWLAHMVQKPEELPHIAYLMFTESTGIGRNWLSSVLVRVLRGYVAAGVDIQAILDGSFNGRLSQKLLSVVDEAKAGMQDRNRYMRSEKLKSIVNQEVREINEKHGLQTVEYNKMRWLFFSNHADALPFDNKDRRIAVIANPVIRASAEYYQWIYDLIGYSEFISAVFVHLMDRVDISNFNPGEHAPMNDAKKQALGEMMTDVEKAVMSFANEWPAELATMSQMRKYVDVHLGSSAGTSAKSRQLDHCIARAGMQSANKTVRVLGSVQRILIVRNLQNYENDAIKIMDSEKIRQIIEGGEAMAKFGEL